MVTHLVFQSVVVRGEERQTDGTSEFIFTLRKVHVYLVRLQICQNSETSAAGRAFVRLLSGMYPLMPPYVRRGSERLSAEPTGVSAGPLVISFVGPQSRDVLEEFAALSTETAFRIFCRRRLNLRHTSSC